LTDRWRDFLELLSLDFSIMIDQMRGGLRLRAGVARRAYRAAFAREGDE